jgi:hypothetical protein
MARAFGVYIHPSIAKEGELEAAVDFQPYRVSDVATLVDTWIPLSNALNALNRTMGQPDVYPFILSPAIIRKLGAIHDLIQRKGLDAANAVKSSAATGSVTAQTLMAQ